MSYEKEIGKILADAINEMVLSDENKSIKVDTPKLKTVSEDKQLQEIRAIERLRMALNKDMLSSDPVAKQRAMRLQALQRRKLEVTHGIGMDEAEGTLKDAKDHSDAERHPWHAEATKAGLTHKSTYTKGSKSYHIYHPDHHWKNGAKLVTTKRKGSPDKHSWEGSAFGDKGNDLKSLHSHLNAGVNNYDSLMAHHKKGTGPFDPKKQ